ncbi:MAG: YbjN domain-containing protein [Oscillospiraceae bacterium]|nr:YbjN domain-containing protein [Oscillospiraceae bacterium]
MFRATEEIAAAFDEANLKYRLEETESGSRLGANVEVNYTAFCIWFISDDDDSDVAVRIPNFTRFRTEAERRKLLKPLNDMNRKFRFCKFVLNRTAQSIELEYDFPQSADQIGQTAVEMFHRIARIADEAYPVFMKALWGGEEFFGNAVFYEYKY